MEIERIFSEKMRGYKKSIKETKVEEVIEIDKSAFNTRFFPDYFKNKLKKIWLRKYKIQGHNVNIYTNDIKYDFGNVTDIISIFYYLFREYSWKSQDFYLFPFNDRKKLSGDCINELNINSAVTTIFFNQVGGPIIIYRKEEMEKVLIHELLHSFHYDLWAPKYNSCTGFGKKCRNNVYSEGFVEANAQILQLQFYNYLHPNKINVGRELKAELKHSYKNACIISHRGGCQTTSAISYFVNKYFILKDILSGNLELYVLFNPKVPNYKITNYDFPKVISPNIYYIKMARFSW
jgi:hypothetical protein